MCWGLRLEPCLRLHLLWGEWIMETVCWCNTVPSNPLVPVAYVVQNPSHVRLQGERYMIKASLDVALLWHSKPTNYKYDEADMTD